MTPALAWELEEARHWVRTNKDKEPWRIGGHALLRLRRLIAEVEESERQSELFPAVRVSAQDWRE